MHFTADRVHKILACDQIAAGLEFDKRPSNQELIFGHILLMYEEGRPVVPRDIARLIGCSAESLRLTLRRAEQGGFLRTQGRPDYEVLPRDRLLREVHKVSQEWLALNQRRLLPTRPTMREVYIITQTFDIYTRCNKIMTFALRSPVKRGISFFILDQDVYGGVDLQDLRHNFPIDHESLRQFINVMIDAGYFEKHRHGKKVFIRPTISLNEVLGEIVENVCHKINDCAMGFSVYSNFVDKVTSEQPEKKTYKSRLLSS